MGDTCDDLRGQFTVRGEAGVQTQVFCLGPELSSNHTNLTALL